MTTQKTITRTDFNNLFSKQLFLPQGKAAALTEVILDEIHMALFKERDLKISSFGTFLVHNKAPRMGRNPKTGKEAVITARKSISFRPSHLLRDKVNRPLKIK
jgi:integration host factor subunit alpha